jgi:hypothetical protein
MTFSKIGGYLTMERAVECAKHIIAKYDDPWDAAPARHWDCSLFVGQVVRFMLGVPDLFHSDAGNYQSTHGFASIAVGGPCGASSLGVFFIHDDQSLVYPSKTVHIGIVLDSPGTSPLVPGISAESLRDRLVMDLYETDPLMGWSIHHPSDWFSATPLSEVTLAPFTGAAAPDFNGNRYAITGARLNLRAIANDARFRG